MSIDGLFFLSFGDVVQQPRQSQVQRGECVAAGLMGERAGEPGFADAARSGDEDVEVLAQPAPRGEGEDEGLVESAGVAEVDVLDAGVGMTQLRAAQSIGHAPVVAHGEFAVDEQAEALLERERPSQAVDCSCSVSAVTMPRHLS